MKDKSWIIILVVSVLLLAGATLLYNNLSSDFAPNQLGGGETVENDNAAGAEDAENTDDAADDAAQTEKDYSAPDFTAVDAEGKEHQLSEYFGKPIVLNFWASWCGPCKTEMPDFEAAYKANPDVQFLMVNVTTSYRESLDTAKAFIAEQGFTFPVLYDVDGIGSATYGTSSIPVTYFIDANGDLVTYGRGMLSAELLQTGLDMITE